MGGAQLAEAGCAQRPLWRRRSVRPAPPRPPPRCPRPRGDLGSICSSWALACLSLRQVSHLVGQPMIGSDCGKEAELPMPRPASFVHSFIQHLPHPRSCSRC